MQESKFNYLCFDLETGGFDHLKNAITEIAIIAYDQYFNEILRFDTFVANYNGLTYDPQALIKTGIKMSDIEGGMDSKDVVDIVCSIMKKLDKSSSRFSNKCILVGHNAATFDRKFLNHFFKLHGLDLSNFVSDYVEDTLCLARQKWAGKIDKFNLGACCQAAGIQLFDAHRAINDTNATFKLHKFLIESLRGGVSVSNTKEETFRDTFSI